MLAWFLVRFLGTGFHYSMCDKTSEHVVDTDFPDDAGYCIPLDEWGGFEVSLDGICAEKLYVFFSLNILPHEPLHYSLKNRIKTIFGNWKGICVCVWL